MWEKIKVFVSFKNRYTKFCLLEVRVLQASFGDFVQLAGELVWHARATCSISKYIYNEVLCEHIIKIYLSYIVGERKGVFI